MKINTKWFLEGDFFLDNSFQNDLIELYNKEENTLKTHHTKKELDEKLKSILVANNLRFIFKVLRDYWIDNKSEFLEIWISNWILWFINSLSKFNKEKNDKLTSCSYNYIRKTVGSIFEQEDESQFADDIRHIIRLFNNIRSSSEKEEYKDNERLLNILIFDIDSVDNFLLSDNIQDYLYLFGSRRREFTKEYFQESDLGANLQLVQDIETDNIDENNINGDKSHSKPKHKIKLKELKAWMKRLIEDEVNSDFLKDRIAYIKKELAWESDTETITSISNDVEDRIFKAELREAYIREIKKDSWLVWATIIERICAGCFLDSFLTLREWSELIWRYNWEVWVNNFHAYFAKFDFKDKNEKDWIYNHYDETLDYIPPEELAEILWVSRQSINKAEKSFKDKFDSYFRDKFNIDPEDRNNYKFEYNKVVHKSEKDKDWEKVEYIPPENVAKYKIKNNLWYQEEE